NRRTCAQRARSAWLVEGATVWLLSRGQAQVWAQLVSGFDGGIPIRSFARMSSDRFQGRNGSMSFGTWLPASAQLCRYQLSHRRGLICPSLSVAKIEKRVAARRPLHRAPEP